MMELLSDSYRGKPVLVTGGCGFIGINLILELLNKKAVVTALDLPEANWNNLPADVRQIKADILNAEDLKEKFNAPEIIFHLAARTDLDGKDKEDYRTNYEGVKNVIREASKNKGLKRFIYFSTQLVVGLFNEKRLIDESEPYRTKTYYGESKIEGEKTVINYCAGINLPYTIIRPTSVYGPWGGTPFKEFFRSIKKKRYYHIGKADNLVSLVYVKNVVDLAMLLAIQKNAENEVFFANDLHPYTMRNIAEEVASFYKVRIKTIPDYVITPIAYFFGFFKILGFQVPIYPFRLRNLKMNYCYNIEKSLKAGYKPAYDLKAGIKETLEWYEKNNLI
jgi:nucleoside-diphosphate-sugar epimerase